MQSDVCEHAAPIAPSDSALASFRVPPELAPTPVDELASIDPTLALLDALEPASSCAPFTPASGSEPATSSARRVALGVPRPVGPSHPLPAVHITSWQRLSLSLVPEVTSLKSAMWS
jgi:hypothetical protein